MRVLPSALALPRMSRFFNTTGPVVKGDHYRIEPLERADLAGLLALVREKRYFALHAPRQTGKTSALLALQERLDADGYRCVYANVEVAQTAREDVLRAMRAVLAQVALDARLKLRDGFLDEIWPDLLERSGPDQVLVEVLTRWAESDARPLVLLLDEIDALVGDSLLAVLRQLRAGYPQRPRGFPQSVVLCGVRDVRDYRIRSSSSREMIAGGSAFNIKARSLRLGDFSRSEVVALLGQHTAETGQTFTTEAVDLLWRQTLGQPWLVNALAYEACFETEALRDRSRPVEAETIRASQERIILRRETHLDQLADKLKEERVRRVVEPLLSGGETRTFSDRDVEYARDLGLLAQGNPYRIANPIYAEVVPRELTWVVQGEFEQDAAWYVESNGGLNVRGLLAAFQDFFREHSEHWSKRFLYQEAWPQLLLQAFLQRVVNGGGRVEREYGLGRGRTDLLLVWPRGGAAAREGDAGLAGGASPTVDRIVIECKVLHGGLEATIAQGLQQTAAYMDRCAASEGHLVIIDRVEGKRWREKVFRREMKAPDGARIDVWGM